MSIRVLHISLNQPILANDHDHVTIAAHILVGFDDQNQTIDVLHTEIALLDQGVYKTPSQMNSSVVDAVKAYMFDSAGIPTDGYAAVFLAGGYGILS